jgi:hypothetical protein
MLIGGRYSMPFVVMASQCRHSNVRGTPKLPFPAFRSWLGCQRWVLVLTGLTGGGCEENNTANYADDADLLFWQLPRQTARHAWPLTSLLIQL